MPSSVIKTFRYDAPGQRLDIVFQMGRHYSYHDVPEPVAEDMRAALSKGEYFNAHIRDHYRYSRER